MIAGLPRRAVIAILAAIPALAVLFAVLTRVMPPLAGYALALAGYWVLFLVPMLAWLSWPRVTWRWPTAPLVALQAVLLLGVGWAAIQAFPGGLTAATMALVVLAALLNGTLEEAFWRGALLRGVETARVHVAAWALFVGWHLALLTQAGVEVTGGAAGLLGGAAFAGAIWSWARWQTGTIGFGVAGHIALNLLAFTELAAKNL